MNETDLLTAKEAQMKLRISSSTFYRYVKDGKLPAIKMGGKTSPWKINKTDLNKLLETSMAKGYKAMAKEHRDIADMAFEAQREIIPEWNLGVASPEVEGE